MLNKCVIEITQSFKTHFLFDFFNFYCLNLINISTIGLKKWFNTRSPEKFLYLQGRMRSFWTFHL